MSHQYTAAAVSLLVVVLPMFGVKVGSEALTVTVQTIVVIASQLWIMIRRYQKGDIKLSGAKR